MKKEVFEEINIEQKILYLSATETIDLVNYLGSSKIAWQDLSEETRQNFLETFECHAYYFTSDELIELLNFFKKKSVMDTQDAKSIPEILIKATAEKLGEFKNEELLSLPSMLMELGFLWTSIPTEFRNAFSKSLKKVFQNCRGETLVSFLNLLVEFQVPFTQLPKSKLMDGVIAELSSTSLYTSIKILLSLCNFNIAWRDLSLEARQAFQQKFQQESKKFTWTKLRLCLHTLTRMGTTWKEIPSELQKVLLGIIEANIEKRICFFPLILWSLAGLNAQLEPGLIEKILLKLNPRLAKLDDLDKRQLLAAHVLMEFKVSPECSAIFSELKENSFVSLREEEILSYLQRINPKIRANVYEEMISHHIDMADCEERIAFEIDGDQHFFQKMPGNVYRSNTSTKMRNRMLEKAGWIVVTIPVYEWTALKEEEKLPYLQKKWQDAKILRQSNSRKPKLLSWLESKPLKEKQPDLPMASWVRRG